MWAIAVASCSPLGLYVPVGYWQWALEAVEEEVVFLPGAQLVFAAVDQGSLVLDCLVPLDVGGTVVRVPLSLRARLPRRRRRPRVPSPVRGWAAHGRLVDISVSDRAGAPVARVYGPHSRAVLELESMVTPLAKYRGAA
jgi:hypothetical protein